MSVAQLTDIIDALKQERNVCLKAKWFDRLTGPTGVNARLKAANMYLDKAKARETH